MGLSKFWNLVEIQSFHTGLIRAQITPENGDWTPKIRFWGAVCSTFSRHMTRIPKIQFEPMKMASGVQFEPQHKFLYN